MSTNARHFAFLSLRALRTGDASPAPPSTFGDQDQQFFLHLFKGTLRFRNYLDSEIQIASDRDLGKIDPDVLDILRLATFDIFFSRTPTYAAIHEAVELAKHANPNSSGFANAILRKISLRTRAENFTLEMLVPKALAEIWKEILSREEIEGSIANLSAPAAVNCRINSLKGNRSEIFAALKQEGVDFEESIYFKDAFYLKSSSFAGSKAFKNGLFYIQNESAQVPVLLLDPQPHEKIMDLCAAPGGKTTQIASATKNKARITAIDRSPKGLKRIEENSSRLGCQNISLLKLDPLKADDREIDGFDRVLVDAPCSSWGTLAAHPEWRWGKDASTPASLAEKQLDFLRFAGQRLKPGGILVYSVCTFSKEETSDVLSSFLSANSGYILEDPKAFIPETMHRFVLQNQFSLALNHPPLDGFYAFRLRKI